MANQLNLNFSFASHEISSLSWYSSVLAKCNIENGDFNMNEMEPDDDLPEHDFVNRSNVM